MPDYKELFYFSQIKIANAIQTFEETAELLKSFMCSHEDNIIESDGEDKNK